MPKLSILLFSIKMIVFIINAIYLSLDFIARQLFFIK